MTYINNSGLDRYVLDDYSAKEMVSFEPCEYWYLKLYAIVLQNKDSTRFQPRSYYLTLEYPSYSGKQGPSGTDNCIWSTPYMAYLFQKKGTMRYQDVQSIVDFYEESIAEHERILEELETYRFYHMGITNWRTVDGKHYIEYKRSPRQPDRWKCYYVHECFVTDVDRVGLLNLCDPEGLHAYHFYPLDAPSINSRKTSLFQGKPLSTNIVELIDGSRKKLTEHTNVIDWDILHYKAHGFLFRADVVGFTALHNQMLDEMRSLDESGKQIADQFISRLSGIFETQMYQYGISQFTIEGDGVTGSIPIASGTDESSILKRILTCFSEIRRAIAELIVRTGTSVCLRCSVMKSDYLYGKISGPASMCQTTGDSLIVLSRMDQYLKEHVVNLPNAPESGIVLCVTNELLALSDVLEEFGYENVDERHMFRETVIDSKAYYLEE